MSRTPSHSRLDRFSVQRCGLVGCSAPRRELATAKKCDRCSALISSTSADFVAVSGVAVWFCAMSSLSLRSVCAWSGICRSYALSEGQLPRSSATDSVLGNRLPPLTPPFRADQDAQLRVPAVGDLVVWVE